MGWARRHAGRDLLFARLTTARVVTRSMREGDERVWDPNGTPRLGSTPLSYLRY